jgi:ATP-binding cassette subfamily B protein
LTAKGGDLAVEEAHSLTERSKTGTEPVSFLTIADRLIKLMRAYPFRVIAAIVLATLAAVLSLSTHAAVAMAIVALMASPVEDALLRSAAAVAVFGNLIRHAAFASATTLSHGIAFRVQETLRLAIARSLAAAPLSALDDASRGSLRTTLINDVEGIEDGMAHLVPEVSAAILAPLIALVVILLIDWRLALLTLAPMAIGIMILGRVMSSGQAATRDYLNLQARMAEVTAETTDALPTVRAFNQDRQATERLGIVIREMTAFSERWMQRAAAPATLAQVLLTSHLLLAGPAGILMAASGAVSVPTLAVFLVVSLGLGDIFAAVQGLSHRMMQQVERLDRIDRLLALRPLPLTREPRQPASNRIEATDVRFAYGDRVVLDDISFTLEPGRMLALVGPSGSGKSTLARLIGRFDDVAAGTIRIGGVDLRDVEPDELNARISFVFQDVFLFGGSIADNLRLARPDASMEALVDATRQARAHDFIAAMPEGYDTLIGEGGRALSGGERQRLSIARAILKDAPILILDEATAFADPESEAEIQSAIGALSAGRSLIVIAHRLRTIVEADEILVLQGGHVVERGRWRDLMPRHGLFRALWDRQGGDIPDTLRSAAE